MDNKSEDDIMNLFNLGFPIESRVKNTSSSSTTNQSGGGKIEKYVIRPIKVISPELMEDTDK